MMLPITWKQFSDAFFKRFFPLTARREMEEQFQKLKQRNDIVDGYAANFLRLSRFAPSMVAHETEKAHRFQQGLQWDIQRQLTPSQLDTYQQVLTAARRVELVTVRENRSKQRRTTKCPIQQVTKNEEISAPPAKRQAQ